MIFSPAGSRRSTDIGFRPKSRDFADGVAASQIDATRCKAPAHLGTGPFRAPLNRHREGFLRSRWICILSVLVVRMFAITDFTDYADLPNPGSSYALDGRCTEAGGAAPRVPRP